MMFTICFRPRRWKGNGMDFRGGLLMLPIGLSGIEAGVFRPPPSVPLNNLLFSGRHGNNNIRVPAYFYLIFLCYIYILCCSERKFNLEIGCLGCQCDSSCIIHRLICSFRILCQTTQWLVLIECLLMDSFTGSLLM